MARPGSSPTRPIGQGPGDTEIGDLGSRVLPGRLCAESRRMFAGFRSR